uniref:Uncharacterized protein n=1 Tax=Podoviridae sp. ctack17 TaxID=2825260 RepID=A0A8S5PZ83_9CAUD|nr:MAG TPA: hypothetical protein [Podoviridae sp. ctack17]
MKHVVVHFDKGITERAIKFLCSLNNSEVKELTQLFIKQSHGMTIDVYKIKFKSSIIHCLMYGDRYIKVYVNDVEPIK